MALRAGLPWELPASYHLHRRTAGEGRDVVTSVEDVSLESLERDGEITSRGLECLDALKGSRAVSPGLTEAHAET